MKPAPKRTGAGRPHKEIDRDQLRKLAVLRPTYAEIAAFFEVGIATVKRAAKSKWFTDTLLEGAAVRNMSLKRAQYKAAIEGNTTMLIWLGKQELDQRDRHELTGKDGGPIEVADANRLREIDAELERLIG